MAFSALEEDEAAAAGGAAADADETKGWLLRGLVESHGIWRISRQMFCRFFDCPGPSERELTKDEMCCNSSARCLTNASVCTHSLATSGRRTIGFLAFLASSSESDPEADEDSASEEESERARFLRFLTGLRFLAGFLRFLAGLASSSSSEEEEEESSEDEGWRRRLRDGAGLAAAGLAVGLAALGLTAERRLGGGGEGLSLSLPELELLLSLSLPLPLSLLERDGTGRSELSDEVPSLSDEEDIVAVMQQCVCG